jgi:hypothetical protein
MGCTAPRPPVPRAVAEGGRGDTRQPTREEQLRRHAYEEARREVRAWIEHRVYIWRPLGEIRS